MDESAYRTARAAAAPLPCVFAKALAPSAPLPHAAAMRLQCGGLQGLRACAAAGDPDVHRAVAAARAKHGSLADLPWTQIVGAIVGWQGRPARSRVPR